jgi:hypothetical protein
MVDPLALVSMDWNTLPSTLQCENDVIALSKIIVRADAKK